MCHPRIQADKKTDKSNLDSSLLLQTEPESCIQNLRRYTISVFETGTIFLNVNHSDVGWVVLNWWDFKRWSGRLGWIREGYWCLILNNLPAAVSYSLNFLDFEQQYRACMLRMCICYVYIILRCLSACVYLFMFSLVTCPVLRTWSRCLFATSLSHFRPLCVSASSPSHLRPCGLSASSLSRCVLKTGLSVTVAFFRKQRNEKH